ncbi:MAG TPA: malto-oligosyltrehalose synthase [Pseudolysinimonas sp.]|nr:malto-oligosyltrehalose synthase [Pseudolysinimonas sp.]
MTPAPRSTYRLQLSKDFPLARAAELADYLHALGVDGYYLSPILQATAGSSHGYDVVDHGQVDADRGGRAGLLALSAAARVAGLFVLVDIVPNHVGVAAPEQNTWWWDVLENGRDSLYADFFDIDWEAGDGRLRIPVLDESISDAIAAGDLQLRHGELHYYDHVYPLAAGSADDGAAVDAVLARQHYELIEWRRADSDINYRRFFAINELAGIRVENLDVFDASHREIARWFTEGLVDGLRVDHPDGLADPGGYLNRLADVTGGAYVLVEKILERGEALPPFWATAGTTGYDALADFDRVLIDPAGQRALERVDSRLRRGSMMPWVDLIHDTKRSIADGILRAEVERLGRELPEVDNAADALAELLACFPVYRSYLPFGAEHLAAARADAVARRPDIAPVIEAVAGVLADPTHPAAIRFQQTSGMVMAKGVEDTAFYRVSRLVSLTEVGADPDEFAIDIAEYHRRQQLRLASYPTSMTTLSTHDTKRGEDTRARVSVLSEIAHEWSEFIARRRRDYALNDGALENLLWESIIGSWPRDRHALHAYAEKAAREAGSATSWSDPDETFEQRLRALVDAAFDDAEVAADIDEIVSRIRQAGWSNGLALKLLQLTGPGVPDVYQGSELWEHSLVDPDNRRPVDFAERRRLLSSLDSGDLPRIDATGAAKMLVVTRALRARRDRGHLFTSYMPLPAFGGAADHLIAVDRGGALVLATRLPIGLAARGGWGDTIVHLPAGPLRDELTGEVFDGGEVPVARLFARYPVALLMPDSRP